MGREDYLNICLLLASMATSVTPLCPYFGSCGGCSAQHIDYPLQLENKKKALARSLRLPEEQVTVFADQPYQYRNRMDFIFHPRGLGFREKDKWWKVVDVEACAISNDSLNVLLKEVRSFFQHNLQQFDVFDIKKKQGVFRYTVIRTPTQDSSISFMLNSDSTKLEEATALIGAFAKTSTAQNILVAYAPCDTEISISEDFFVVKGKDVIKETLLGKTFEYPIQGFFQNNTVMAEKMQDYVHHLLKNYPTQGAHLLDLYGGVGCFGIINASLFKSATIVESVESSIACAQKNIQENKITNAQAMVLDAAKLKKLELPKPAQPLFVITDPPRSGMHPKTIEHLNLLQPEVLIYVSCNIDQLGKDIPKFKNYQLKSAALFDFFPQTNHAEAVVELVRLSTPKTL